MLGALTDKLGTVGWVHDLAVLTNVAVPFVVALLRRIGGRPVPDALAGTPCVRATGGRHA